MTLGLEAVVRSGQVVSGQAWFGEVWMLELGWVGLGSAKWGDVRMPWQCVVRRSLVSRRAARFGRVRNFFKRNGEQ